MTKTCTPRLSIYQNLQRSNKYEGKKTIAEDRLNFLKMTICLFLLSIVLVYITIFFVNLSNLYDQFNNLLQERCKYTK